MRKRAWSTRVAPVKPIVFQYKDKRPLNTRGLFLLLVCCPYPVIQLSERPNRSRTMTWVFSSGSFREMLRRSARRPTKSYNLHINLHESSFLQKPGSRQIRWEVSSEIGFTLVYAPSGLAALPCDSGKIGEYSLIHWILPLKFRLCFHSPHNIICRKNIIGNKAKIYNCRFVAIS